jgi:hypothetical protein
MGRTCQPRHTQKLVSNTGRPLVFKQTAPADHFQLPLPSTEAIAYDSECGERVWDDLRSAPPEMGASRAR